LPSSGNQPSYVAFAEKSAFREYGMNGLIYLVGLVVVIMAVLSFIGIH